MTQQEIPKIGDTAIRMNEPPSAEEMERRREIASLLRSLVDRPTSQVERVFWQEFQADLERDRPRFRGTVSGL
jgi:hypothetical protein